jgi:hypothetical protein
MKGIMGKSEFMHITSEVGRITAHAYSENRIVDVGEVPRKLVWMLVFSYIISMTVLLLMYLAIDSGPYPGLDPDNIFIGLMITLLSIGAGVAMSVMFLNYFAKDKHLPSYKERLSFYLQNYFDEINAAVFRRRGLLWKLGNRAKWIELHIIKIGDDGQGGVKAANLATVPEEDSPQSKHSAKGGESERKLLNEGADRGDGLGPYDGLKGNQKEDLLKPN